MLLTGSLSDMNTLLLTHEQPKTVLLEACKSKEEAANVVRKKMHSEAAHGLQTLEYKACVKCYHVQFQFVCPWGRDCVSHVVIDRVNSNM